MKLMHLLGDIIRLWIKLSIFKRKVSRINLPKYLIILLAIVAFGQATQGQTKLITGTVVDSVTRAPLQNVSVTAKNSAKGTLTDAKGQFLIVLSVAARKITLSSAGYNTVSWLLNDSSVQLVTVKLSRSYTLLGDVVVNAKIKKYRNKNNPAVDLIRQVIANKSKNGPASNPYASFQQYEKIRVFLDKFPSAVRDNRLLRDFHFLFENEDSLLVPGKILVPIYIEETLSDHYFRQHPRAEKKVVVGRKNVNYGEYLDMKGISGALNRMYEDLNIYDNAVSVFTTQFESPIADLAPTFYMYFILDTVIENGKKLVELYFTPRNSEDLLLRGTLYITLDGHYALQRVELGISKHTNLNYVQQFRVKQDFAQGPEGHYYLAYSNELAVFSPFANTPGFFADRTVSNGQPSNLPIADSLFAGPLVDTIAQAYQHSDSLWAAERPIALTQSESRIYTDMDSLVTMKSYKRVMNYGTFLTAGYISAGKFDIGPAGTFYSFNPVEGNKLRFGGRSNTKLSTRYYTEDYIAYGFKDQRWKYYVSGTYAFNNKSIYTFPFNYLQASFLYDTRHPGQENVFANGNTFLSSFTRGDNSKWLYNYIGRLNYVRELENHFSYNLGIKYWQQLPAGSLAFIYEPSQNQFDTVAQITTTELSLTLRYAPHERFYQGKTSRTIITDKYPIFTFQYAIGIKGLLSGQYNYNAFHVNVYKRVYLAPFGFSDVTLDGGYLQGNLPFPLLVIHPANQSYFYIENAYNLMNYEEFVSDHYAGINIDHSFNGFFFNKIPLLKRLRLREVIAGKLLFGGVRSENNPDQNPEQMKFPVTNGITTTFALNGKPYLEASVGIYNIFSIFRLDLVKRFSYLYHPGISSIGLRVSSNFYF
jgi:Family of unknown function (DUF5686)/CarboxypepD_reg-like domain